MKSRIGVGCIVSLMLVNLISFPLATGDVSSTAAFAAPSKKQKDVLKDNKEPGFLEPAQNPKNVSDGEKHSKETGHSKHAKHSKTSRNSERSEKSATGDQPEFIPIVSWRDSDVTSWATLLCVHGLGLHKYVYAPFGKQMARAGVTTYAIDVHGFGSWKNSDYGRRLNLNKAVKDVKAVVELIRKRNPGRPVVLLGESMGGAVVLQAAASNPELIDGVIACVPSGVRYKQKRDGLKTALGLFRGPSKPMNLGPGLVNRVTEDEELKDRWVNDPKARLGLTPKELIRFQSFMNRTAACASEIKNLPVLVVQGGQDRLVKAKGTRSLFEQISSDDKDFVILGKSEHLIFEEGQFDQQVVNVVSAWILKHIVASSASMKKVPDGADGAIGAQTSVRDSILKANFDPQVQQLATGHFFLGQGYLRLKQPELARENFKKVRTLAPGTLLAREADTLLLTALKEKKSGDGIDSKEIAKVVPRFVSPKIGFGNDRPTMVSFYTKWLTKRDEIWHALQELQLKYEGKLNMVRIDADDPASQDLVKHYGVCAVPTFIFLDPENNFVDEKVGCIEQKDIISGITEILPTVAK